MYADANRNHQERMGLIHDGLKGMWCGVAIESHRI